MKKIISLLLVAVLCFQLGAITFAKAEADRIEVSDTQVTQYQNGVKHVYVFADLNKSAPNTHYSIEYSINGKKVRHTEFKKMSNAMIEVTASDKGQVRTEVVDPSQYVQMVDESESPMQVNASSLGVYVGTVYYYPYVLNGVSYPRSLAVYNKYTYTTWQDYDFRGKVGDTVERIAGIVVSFIDVLKLSKWVEILIEILADEMVNGVLRAAVRQELNAVNTYYDVASVNPNGSTQRSSGSQHRIIAPGRYYDRMFYEGNMPFGDYYVSYRLYDHHWGLGTWTGIQSYYYA